MSKVSHDSETKAEGQQVITACAFIHHDFDGIEKVFLPKRADTKKFLPGVYELPGGHINYGEDIVVGLKREINEELGVNINVGDPFAVHDAINEIKGSHSAEIIYFAQLLDPLENIRTNPEDHSDFGWFAEQEIDTLSRVNRQADDPEFIAIRRGFELLKGNLLNFG